jgi:hypothetical protein
VSTFEAGVASYSGEPTNIAIVPNGKAVYVTRIEPRVEDGPRGLARARIA